MRRTASPVSSALRVVTVVLVHSTRCGLRRAGPILSLAHTLSQKELFATWPAAVRPRSDDLEHATTRSPKSGVEGGVRIRK